MNVEIEDSEVDYVIEVVRKFYGKNAGGKQVLVLRTEYYKVLGAE